MHPLPHQVIRPMSGNWVYKGRLYTLEFVDGRWCRYDRGPAGGIWRGFSQAHAG